MDTTGSRGGTLPGIASRTALGKRGGVRVGNGALEPKVLAKIAPPDLKYLGQHQLVTFVDQWIESLKLECKIVFPSQ